MMWTTSIYIYIYIYIYTTSEEGRHWWENVVESTQHEYWEWGWKERSQTPLWE